jgi:hypothetical protein
MTKSIDSAIHLINLNSEENNSMDELAEYLEYMSRTTPTATPEWMD